MTILMLPSNVLAEEKSSGSRHRRVQARVRDLMREGRREAATEDLPDTGPQPAAQRRPPPPGAADQMTAKRIQRHLAHGNVSKAAGVLDSLPLAPPTAATLSELQRLHPTSAPPHAPPPPAQPTAPAYIDADEFLRVLDTLPKSSAAGPSGWTYEHLRAGALAREPTRDALRGLVNDLLAGLVPLCPLLTASRLVALQKPSGGVRPIAVGESLLRLACLCALRTVPTLGASLAPFQLGVGVPGGPQALSHALRAGMADTATVTIRLDLENAFNRLDRTVMLQAVADRAPSLLPLATYLYSEPSSLHVGWAPDAQPISCSSGVLQGSPLSPTCFAVAFQPTLQGLHATVPDAAAVALHDDTFVQGTVEDAVAAARYVIAAHDVNAAKTQVHCADPQVAAHAASLLGCQAVSDGLVIGGIPVGTEAFERTHVESRCTKTEQLVDTLLGLPLSPQSQWALLSGSLQHRDVHLLRGVPWTTAENAFARLQERLLDGFCRISSIAELSPLQRARLLMPIRHGGFGLARFEKDVADAAFLAAGGLAHSALQEGHPRLRPLSNPEAATYAQRWERLVTEYPSIAPPPPDPPPSPDPPPAPPHPPPLPHQALPSLQRKVAHASADASHARLVEDLRTVAVSSGTSEERETAMYQLAAMHSCEGTPSGAWLTALPLGTTRMDRQEWMVSARMRLGERMLPAVDDEDTEFCACGARLGPDGEAHFAACPSLGASRISRHYLVVNAWSRNISKAGVSNSLEPAISGFAAPADVLRDPAEAAAAAAAPPPASAPPPVQVPPPVPSAQASTSTAAAAPTTRYGASAPAVPASPEPAAPDGPAPAPAPAPPAPDASRGDICVFFATDAVVTDVSITHPTSRSFVARAAAQPGYAAAERDRVKRTKYQGALGSYRFVPLVHETYGRLGAPAYSFLQELADVAAASGSTSKREFLGNALRDLSVALCKGLARQARLYAPLRRRATGKALRPGLAVPTAALDVDISAA